MRVLLGASNRKLGWATVSRQWAMVALHIASAAHPTGSLGIV